MLEKKGTKLYRGTGLTKEELNKYAALIGKRKGKEGMVCLTGFISTSMNRGLAESFAWSNEE